MKKILAFGGVDYLNVNTIIGVTPVIGDEPAAELGVRSTDVNIATVRIGDKDAKEYGVRRRAELADLVMRHAVTLNVHGNPDVDGDVVFIHPEANVTVRCIAPRLEIRRVALTTGNTLTGTYPRVATIDLGRNSPVTTKDLWRLAYDLAEGVRLPYDMDSIIWYESLRDVTPHEVNALGFPNLSSFQSFEELPKRWAEALGFSTPVFGAFWNEKTRGFQLFGPGKDPWKRR